ncbi:hypothetical protein D9M71_179870 [compost metagenome]
MAVKRKAPRCVFAPYKNNNGVFNDAVHAASGHLARSHHPPAPRRVRQRRHPCRFFAARPGRFFRRQQRHLRNPQHVLQPRLSRWHQCATIQARRMGPGLHAQPGIGLHRGRGRFWRRYPGHARHQARFQPRPHRHRPVADPRRRPRRRRILQARRDRQGENLRQRAQGRHPDSRVADPQGQRRAHPAADLRRWVADVQRVQKPDLHRRAPGKGQGPRRHQRRRHRS